uniref:Apoptotic chromatin condensation inducer in the nucleus n=1 Tax=Ascaris suum TaxID=6253 RepID=F1L1F0_ASCSU
MDNEKERVVAADIENDLSLCGQVGMRPFGMLMEDVSELNSDVTSKALDVEKEIRLNLPSPSTEVIGSREIASHAGACGGQTKELENDEVSKQSTSDPSYEKTQPEEHINKVEASIVTPPKTFPSADGQLEEAAVKPHDSETVKMNDRGFPCKQQVTPARYPLSQVVMIRQLTRPFTSERLKRMLSTFGTIVEGGFWIDTIKSTCIVKYSSIEEAVAARDALHNTFWPHGNPKELKVDYSNESELIRRLAADLTASHTNPKHCGAACHKALSADTSRVSKSMNQEIRILQAQRSRSPPTHNTLSSKKKKHEDELASDSNRQGGCHSSDSVRGNSEKPKKPDDLFKRTTTMPAIYYVALTDDEVAEHAKRKATKAEIDSAKGAAARRLKEGSDELTRRARSRSPHRAGAEQLSHSRSRCHRC